MKEYPNGYIKIRNELMNIYVKTDININKALKLISQSSFIIRL